MAILQKTREKAGLAVSIIIALALLSFIIDPGTLETAFNAMSSRNDVGAINGKSIGYTDFQQDVDNLSTIYEMQTGTSSQNEQQQEQIRNEAWQTLVSRYLLNKTASAAGLNVGKEEMKELLFGENASPVIRDFFTGQNGEFSSEKVKNFYNSLSQDATGRTQALWNYLRTRVYDSQYYSKYANLLTQNNLQSPLMRDKDIEGNNVTTNVDFVMVPFFGAATDSTLTVSDSEIQKYYEARKRFTKQPASRDIEYVVFEVKPSAADIELARQGINSLMEEFSTTDNLRAFLNTNNSSYSEYWYKAGELNSVSSEINDFVFGNAEGTSEVVQSGNMFRAARIMKTAQIPDSVYVKYIVLSPENVALADSLIGVIKKGENFSNVATAFSLDTRTATDGELGTIGWMTQAMMPQGLETTLTAPLNEPYLAKALNGYSCILEVTKRTAPVTKKQVAILEKEAVAGGDTRNEYYSQASRFVALAKGSYDNYLKAVDSLGVYSHPITVLESTGTYGAIDTAREVTRWAFDNKPGKVSDIMSVDNNYYFIATVKGIHKEGTPALDEVKDGIKSILLNEAASRKAAVEVAQKIKGLGDLQTIADTLHTSVSPSVDIHFAALGAQQLDPKFIGAASVAPEGQICGPVAGNYGTYVFKVNSRETESFYTEDDAKQAALQKSSVNLQSILGFMIQEKVTDHRARFF